MGHHNMKKLLIASSVLTALTMGVAHAEPSTLNGGTVEFIGEITDTTCYVDVQGTVAGTAGPADTSNVVLLPVVSNTLLNGAKKKTAGRTPFFLQVHTESTYDAPAACTLGNIQPRDSHGLPVAYNAADPATHAKPATKVKAIFGASLTSSSINNTLVTPAAYNTDDLGNIDMTNNWVKNIASQTTNTTRTWDRARTDTPSPDGAATGVALQILDKNQKQVKVGDITSQLAANTGVDLGTGTNTTSIPFFVEYISTDTSVTPGMVRGFVTYELSYE